jgi:hypothetical protein
MFDGCPDDAEFGHYYLRGLAVVAGFAPVVELVSTVRPLASRAVAPTPLCWMVLVVRPLASRKVARLSNCDSVRSLRPAASR